MEVTRQWYDIWSESMRYVFSDHDNLASKHDDWEYIVVNYIWPTMIQETAKLAKNHPKILADPTGDEDAEAAEVWQGATQWQWQEGLRMRLHQLAAIFCGKIFGYRVSKFYWNPKPRHGWDKTQKIWNGDVEHRLWNPVFFWADGEESVEEGNCGTVRWVRLEWAKWMWPGHDKEFDDVAVTAKDAKEAAFGDVKFKSWMSGGSMVQSDADDVTNLPLANRLLNMINGCNQFSTESTQKMVRVGNTYMLDEKTTHRKDYEPITVDELLESGTVYVGMDQQLFDVQTNLPYNPPEWPTRLIREYDEPDYPDGRMVLSAGEGDKRFLLNPKEDDQVYPYSRWPFVVTPHYILPFMWQGVNAVTMYKTQQDMINLSVTHMFNNLKQFGDPRIAIEDGAIAINPKTKQPWTIKSGAGALIRLLKGGLGRYKVEPPLPLSPAAIQFYQIQAQEFKNLSGLQPIAQGQQLKSGTTATEAQTLAISANDRIFLQGVYEDEWVKGCAYLIAEIMQLHYDEGRYIKIIGEDTLNGVKQITSGLKNARYDISVVPGMTLPFDEEKRIAKLKMAYELLMQPTANPMLPEMLRALDVPNWKKILDEYPVWQDYQALLRLVEGVKTGQVDPKQAMTMIVNRLMQLQGGEILKGMTQNAESQNKQNSAGKQS